MNLIITTKMLSVLQVVNVTGLIIIKIKISVLNSFQKVSVQIKNGGKKKRSRKNNLQK